MKNYVQPGKKFEITAGADIESGAPVVVGDLVLIASGKILSGAKGILESEGVFTLPKKAATAMAQGITVYWDAGAGEVTNNANAGANKKIGFVHVAALAADATINVVLAH